MASALAPDVITTAMISFLHGGRSHSGNRPQWV